MLTMVSPVRANVARSGTYSLSRAVTAHRTTTLWDGRTPSNVDDGVYRSDQCRAQRDVLAEPRGYGAQDHHVVEDEVSLRG
jgi:hypothetical protein